MIPAHEELNTHGPTNSLGGHITAQPSHPQNSSPAAMPLNRPGMLIGNAIAEGASLGDWEQGEKAQAVFYFDAEMNLADVQERARKLRIVSANFRWLSNEQLFIQGGAGVNIASPGASSGPFLNAT